MTTFLQFTFERVATSLETNVYVLESFRLHFPGQIKETEYTSGKYDSDKGQFTFIVNKVNKGEHFPDLDLISKLLIPPNKHRSVQPGIEVSLFIYFGTFSKIVRILLGYLLIIQHPVN